MTRVALALLAVLLVSCSGTETGNPPDAKLRVGLHSSSADEVGLRTNAPLDVTQANLGFHVLELVSCEQEGVPVVSEPRLLDLFESDSWSLPPGRYCSLHLDLSPVGPEQGAARVEFVDQAGQRFLYLRDMPLDLTLDFVQAHPVAAGDVLTLSLDVGLLLAGKDLPPGPPSSDTTVLSSVSNPNQFGPIDVALPSSLNVYSGANGEGQLTAPP
ncbi:MAG TPA: hypothetical protein VM686_08170 [Polyangiaceae bacterium]|nr:hypothetical protein [Polyangiaceae bacterium]